MTITRKYNEVGLTGEGKVKEIGKRKITYQKTLPRQNKHKRRAYSHPVF